MDKKGKILIVCGPTASGKTALAVECAKLLNSEVVSADSMYIYKDLNIGTAKPTEEEMQGVKHHMIDIVNFDADFSVSDYKNLATPIIDDIISRGKIPVICGGTGFYINSILFDLSYGNSTPNFKVREKYNKLAEEKGNEYVHSILMQKDSETASKLHYNDLKRVIRALEICESGVKKCDLHDDLSPLYDYSAFSINHDRSTLYDRINLRVDLMVKQGLLAEMERLIKLGANDKLQSMQAIGYKEFFQYYKNEITLEQALDQIKLNTRHYAKRQITFFKRLDNLVYLQPQSVEKLAQRIVDSL